MQYDSIYITKKVNKLKQYMVGFQDAFTCGRL